MAKRKSQRKNKKSPKKSRKKISIRTSLLKALAGLSILVILVAIIGIVAHYVMPPKQPSSALPPQKALNIKKPSEPQKPPFEIYPIEKVPVERPPAKPEKPSVTALPKVAIIIDDLGYDQKIAEKFLELDAVFTFSLLPYSPFQEIIARRAQDKGLEVMLHLPMEPMEYPAVDPGPGTLLASMSPDELIDQLEKDLDTLPAIKGVNNHMGSKLTAESSQLYQIFSVLKKRGLFFIDSRTTAKTLGQPSARLFKIPFAQRDVFLDHRQDPAFIRMQVMDLINIAKRHGVAVGIAHPHTSTYNILKEMLPDLKREVDLVPASEVVQVTG